MASAGSKIPVLIADDDEFFLKYFEIILGEQQYDVSMAADGKEAYRMYLAAKPALIITDVYMPVMSGLDLISQIRGSDSVTPIIAVSSEDEPVDRAIAAGANVAIKKPFEKTKLDDVIRKVLTV